MLLKISCFSHSLYYLRIIPLINIMFLWKLGWPLDYYYHNTNIIKKRYINYYKGEFYFILHMCHGCCPRCSRSTWTTSLIICTGCASAIKLQLISCSSGKTQWQNIGLIVACSYVFLRLWITFWTLPVLVVALVNLTYFLCLTSSQPFDPVCLLLQ